MNYLLNKLKSKIKDYKSLYIIILRIKFFLKGIKNIIIHHRWEKREFIILNDKKLIYLNNSKTACSSIKKTFINKKIKDDYSIHFLNWNETNKIENDYEEFFKFTFVRNPFDRLVSCYESKFKSDSKKGVEILHYDKYLLGILNKDKGFDNFVKKIIKIPKFLADRHFESQYRLIFDKNQNCLVDYVGKYENINEEFQFIKERFKLSSLPHYNKSDKKNWKNYYTKETAELVYKYYKKDIEEFNYEKEYNDLIEYIEEEKN